MTSKSDILSDPFGRVHNYLRISLTERCNLRCSYCMPEHGVQLSPKDHLMTAEEVINIASTFVDNGVTKIRLTGGEPLVRKDFSEILKGLSKLNVKLSLTTNAVLVDRYIQDFEKYNLKDINVSLDTLKSEKFRTITKRNQFSKAYQNIKTLQDRKFNVKVNVVLMKNFNESEIIDFIELTRNERINVRFIEFMPFDGNQWNTSKLVTQQEIFERVNNHFGEQYNIPLPEENNFTSRNYRIHSYKGTYGIISSVSNPFCDGCNRIRLTANGKLKNCLFSGSETDILSSLRKGKNLEHLIKDTLMAKRKVRAGMDTMEKLKNPVNHNKNRSMITIGG